MKLKECVESAAWNFRNKNKKGFTVELHKKPSWELMQLAWWIMERLLSSRTILSSLWHHSTWEVVEDSTPACSFHSTRSTHFFYFLNVKLEHSTIAVVCWIFNSSRTGKPMNCSIALENVWCLVGKTRLNSRQHKMASQRRISNELQQF